VAEQPALALRVGFDDEGYEPRAAVTHMPGLAEAARRGLWAFPQVRELPPPPRQLLRPSVPAHHDATVECPDRFSAALAEPVAGIEDCALADGHNHRLLVAVGVVDPHHHALRRAIGEKVDVCPTAVVDVEYVVGVLRPGVDEKRAQQRAANSPQSVVVAAHWWRTYSARAAVALLS